MCSSSVSSNAGTTASVPRRGRSSSAASRSTVARSSGCRPRCAGRWMSSGRSFSSGWRGPGRARTPPQSVTVAGGAGVLGDAGVEPRGVQQFVRGAGGRDRRGRRAAGQRVPLPVGPEHHVPGGQRHRGLSRPDEPARSPQDYLQAGGPGHGRELLRPRGVPGHQRRARSPGPHERDHVAEHVHPARVSVERRSDMNQGS